MRPLFDVFILGSCTFLTLSTFLARLVVFDFFGSGTMSRVVGVAAAVGFCPVEAH